MAFVWFYVQYLCVLNNVSLRLVSTTFNLCKIALKGKMALIT